MARLKSRRASPGMRSFRFVKPRRYQASALRRSLLSARRYMMEASLYFSRLKYWLPLSIYFLETTRGSRLQADSRIRQDAAAKPTRGMDIGLTQHSNFEPSSPWQKSQGWKTGDGTKFPQSICSHFHTVRCAEIRASHHFSESIRFYHRLLAQ